MVFYFSGTGNSKYIAELIAKNTSDKAISIASCFREENFIFSDKKIGFVFPIHAWQPPLYVQNFLRKISIKSAENTYFYVIYVCGEDIGNSNHVVSSIFKTKEWKLSLGATLQMPNNYIISFDTDSEETVKGKIESATEKVKDLSDKINKQEKYEMLIHGKFAAAKTRIIAPLFQKHMINAKPFHIEGQCIGCKVCENNCPTLNIKVENNSVCWGDNCTFCLSCIHRCPEKVIQYAKSTQNKGRYYFK